MMRVCDRVVVYANQRALEMFAGSAGPEGFVGQPSPLRSTRRAATTSSAPSQRSSSVAPLTRVRLGGPANRRRGRLRPSHVTQLSDPAQDELWMAVVEDITAFKRAAIALEEANRDLAEALTGSEQSFQRIVDSGMFGMFRGKLPPAPDAGVVHANRAFCQMLGWSEAEILDGALRAPSPLFSPEGRGEALRSAEELRARGYSALSDTELVRKDGSRVPVLIGAALSSELELSRSPHR